MIRGLCYPAVCLTRLMPAGPCREVLQVLYVICYSLALAAEYPGSYRSVDLAGFYYSLRMDAVMLAVAVLLVFAAAQLYEMLTEEEDDNTIHDG